MNRKIVIRKIIVLTAWILVITGITTLLVAANRKQKEHLCSQMMITMKGGKGIYIEKADILKLVEKIAKGGIINRPLSKIDLGRLEKGLESDPWIRNAEMYLDSKDALHILIEERQPIARVFTSSRSSFYIDSSGHAMPLLEKMSARVPVITGFPSGTRWNARDSSLMKAVKNVAGYIYDHEFWNAQVGQIDITPDRKFELIPVVGDHTIRLGDGEQTAERLQRLYVFYKQVLSKTGFNRYATLDLQYNGQVIAVKKEAINPVDSIQLQKNIEDLMVRANSQQGDQGMLITQDQNQAKKDSAVSKSASQTNQVSTKTNPTPIERSQSKSPGRPKAVMTKRSE